MMPEDFTSCDGPCLAIYRNAMYVAFNGPDRETGLWWSRFDGISWEPKQRVGNHSSPRSPGLMVYRGALNLAHREDSAWGPNAIWWAFYDGAVWADRTGPGLVTTERPALAVHGQKLVVVHKGNDDDESIYYSTLDGLKWSEKQTVGGSTDSGPSVVNYQGRLYAAWKEAGDDQTICYSMFDGNVWTTAKSLPGTLAIGSWPSLAAFNDQIYIVWRGWDSKLWWARTKLSGMNPFPPHSAPPTEVQPTPVMNPELSLAPLPVQPESAINPEPMAAPMSMPVMNSEPAPVPMNLGQTQAPWHGVPVPLPASRRSSSSSNSEDDLKRLKRGVKKGVSELSGKFKSRFLGK
jgi:hypothetical protein